MASNDLSEQSLIHTMPALSTNVAERHAAEARQELTQAIVESHKPLFTARTVFPFTLFPDTVVLDRTKLTLTHRTFFWTAEVMSIRIEDVLNVTADVGPLFGSVKIATRFYRSEDAEKPYAVNYLWRNDALKIKRIVQGYIIALQREIDCSSLSSSQLAALLDELGHGGIGEQV